MAASQTTAISPSDHSQTHNHRECIHLAVTSIKQLSQFLQIEPQQIIKSVAVQAEGAPVIVLVRGDLEINEIKLKQVLGVQEITLLSEAEITVLRFNRWIYWTNWSLITSR